MRPHYAYARTYVDDLIIFSDTWEEHVQHLIAVLTDVEKNGMKISRTKSTFGSKEVDFLGFMVNEHGMRPNPTKVSQILSIKAPTNKKDLQSFLGSINFYRGFISNVSEETKTLREVVKKNDKDFYWTCKEEKAFTKLKQALSQTILHAHPDKNLPYHIVIKATNEAIAGSIYQIDEYFNEEGRSMKKNTPIAYETRKLKGA